MVVPAATSIILQGSPKTARKTLFLFPDGAGSATSYSGIPRVGAETAIICLNSPFYRNPIPFKCTLDSLITSYLTEIHRRQPTGPYSLGGWSAGGILAYRAAQQLIDSGQTVENLILIDSPPPKGLDRLPQHFYDFCNDNLHLFGHSSSSTTTRGASAGIITKTATAVARKAPDWLLPHFNATIDTLHEYFADPLPRDKTPKTSLLWACDSVMDGQNIAKMPIHPDDSDTDGMKFLTQPRTDFSAKGWEDLFPGVRVRIERAVGANHFSMMVSSPSSLPRSVSPFFFFWRCLALFEYGTLLDTLTNVMPLIENIQRGAYAPKLARFISEALA
jgi:thioesterase domain-containing protein